MLAMERPHIRAIYLLSVACVTVSGFSWLTILAMSLVSASMGFIRFPRPEWFLLAAGKTTAIGLGTYALRRLWSSSTTCRDRMFFAVWCAIIGNAISLSALGVSAVLTTTDRWTYAASVAITLISLVEIVLAMIASALLISLYRTRLDAMLWSGLACAIPAQFVALRMYGLATSDDLADRIHEMRRISIAFESIALIILAGAVWGSAIESIRRKRLRE